MKVYRIFIYSLILLVLLSMRNTHAFSHTGLDQLFVLQSLPRVSVSIQLQDAYLVVQVNEQAPQILTELSPLIQGYEAALLQVRDLNHDGIAEIAVLSSVNFGGTTLCYEVFEYQATSQTLQRLASASFCRKV